MTEGPFTFGQLKAMYQTGAINAEALVCPNGEEEWTEARWMLEEVEAELGRPSTMQGMPVRQVANPGTVKLRRGQKNGCVSGFLFLVGIALLFVFWPLGLLVILAALIMDHTGSYSMCGACRNEVAPKSRVCPVCGSYLKRGWF